MTETTERADVGQPPDAHLWDLIAQGDHAAFAELFERHAEAVWNYAYRLTASWSQAEDLLSATFPTAWRKRGEARSRHHRAERPGPRLPHPCPPARPGSRGHPVIDQLPEHRTPALIAAGVSLLAAGAVFAGQALTSGPAELAGPSYQHNGEFVGKDRAVVNHVEPAPRRAAPTCPRCSATARSCWLRR